MPYTIARNEDGKYCVYKRDENDEPMGESLDCHDTQDEAAAQIGAIEANEKAVKRPTQAEVHYTTVSQKDAGCAVCRWYDEAMKYCHIIDNGPEDIVSTGSCDRHEAGDESHVSYDIDAPAPEVTVTDIDATEPDSSAVYASPTSNAPGVIKALADKLRGGLKPGTSVIKGADGKRYMFIVTSNSYKDRENETISTEALKRYVDQEWTADDYFQGSNKHLVWHMDDLDVGNIVWADMAGPFLVEVAREGDSPIAKAAYDYWETAGDDLGASHRFKYYTHERDGDGTYHVIRKTETSSFPRSHAANLLTFSGVLPMSEARNTYLDKMFGIEGVAELLKDGPQKLEAALAARGIEHKSIDDPAEATEKAENSFAELVVLLTETQADTLKQLDEVKALLQESVELHQADKAASEAALKAQADELAALKVEFGNSPRSTVAHLNAEEQKDAQAEIEDRNRAYNGNDMLARMQALMREGK